jgi:nitrogen regulatory protein P-II 1
VTVQTVDGHGRQAGEVEYFRGQPVRQRLVQKTQITIGVNDKYVEPAIQAILGAAKTDKGEIGDGKIFVVPLEECVRIRTGERGGSAI